MNTSNANFPRKKGTENLKDRFSAAARSVANSSGHPVTFLIATSVIMIWAITGPMFHYNDTWQLVINTGTTIVTFLMVFLIQNTQNRDSAAVQLKLDELIRAVEGARNHVIALEDKSEEELDMIKNELSQLAVEAQELLDAEEPDGIQ